MESRPLVLGHRGVSAYAVSNSIEAFELAVAHGADGVELDVRFTADEVVVLQHDADIGEMGPLIHHDFATVRSHHPEIPTLDEAFAVLGDLIVNVEIKNFPMDPDYDPTHRMAPLIARWVARHDIHHRVIVTSFNPDTVAAVRQADGTIVTGQLINIGFDCRPSLESVAAAGHSWIAPYVGDVLTAPTAVIDAAHGVGLQVVTWTVDDPGDIRTVAVAGVDAIISNDPRAVREVLTDTP